MTRETRFNLLFLAAFLAVSTPGAVILFKKRLDPTSPRMTLPDAIRHQVPYMAPGPLGPQDRRVVPPLTGQWLAGVARERAVPGSVLLVHPDSPGGYVPTISDDRRVEVVAYRLADGTGASTFDLLLWGDGDTVEQIVIGAGRWVPAGDRGEFDDQIAEAQIDVLSNVRRELRDLGYVEAPKAVRWVRVEMTHLRPWANGVIPLVVRDRASGGTSPKISSVNLSTNPRQ